MGRNHDDQYAEQEAQRRFEVALRGSRAVGHKTYEESKVGKPRRKRTLGKVATKPTKAKKHR